MLAGFPGEEGGGGRKWGKAGLLFQANVPPGERLRVEPKERLRRRLAGYMYNGSFLTSANFILDKEEDEEDDTLFEYTAALRLNCVFISTYIIYL